MDTAVTVPPPFPAHTMTRTAGLAASLLITAFGAVAPATESPQDIEFFEKKVRPLLVKHCYECHSAESGDPEGGLLLDRKSGWEKGGELGPAIAPGDPDKSLLIRAV